ncbi:MAG: trypsin-like peptidase domain-containing protein [Candidatus Promineifilaceae bacterium]|nr:trypsin-like peptidase domain-containing protein [Candidatus Promineifilaceae bacterium]
MSRTKTFNSFLLVIVIVVLTACGAFYEAEGEIQPVSQAEQGVIESIVDQVDPNAAAQAPAIPAPIIQSNTAVQPGQLFAHEEAFINLFESVSPSVVHVGVDNGQGSGFVFDERGFIVTNNHVVAGARNIVVSFQDGTDLDATVFGTDPGSDLAVLKVEAAPGYLKALTLADSDNLRVGQIVLAIGSPFGLANTLTTGIISGLDRLFPGAQAPSGGSYNIPDIIQTDAAINPGNSGGPLLDTRGNVIGVNTAIESPVRGSSGVGFAVPSNVVAVVVPQLIDGGTVSHPWLGVSGTELNASLAESLDLDRDQRGIVLAEVIEGGPAEAAGIRAGSPGTGLGGDVIIGINDQEVREFDDLLGYIVGKTHVGDTVNLLILRDGQELSVPVILGERPSVEE